MSVGVMKDYKLKQRDLRSHTLGWSSHLLFIMNLSNLYSTMLVSRNFHIWTWHLLKFTTAPPDFRLEQKEDSFMRKRIVSWED